MAGLASSDMPKVSFHQGKKGNCLVCALASALSYFGDDKKAALVMEINKVVHQGELWDNLKKVMESKKEGTISYSALSYERYKEAKDNGEKVGKNGILMVVLKASDGGVNHGVAIVHDYIFNAKVFLFTLR